MVAGSELSEPRTSWDGGLSVVGDGLLARCIARVASSVPAVVVASDGWDISAHADVRRRCAQQAVPWLPVHSELGRVVIGPLELPGVTGCGHCAQLRRARAGEQTVDLETVQRRYGAQLSGRASSWLTNLAADTVAAVVSDELEQLGTDPAAARTYRALIYVDLEDLRITRHRFLPDPLCDVCGDLPDDSAELAAITLGVRPKLGPDTHRVRRVLDELDLLLDTYVDPEAGLIRRIHQDTMGGLVLAGAMMPIRSHPGAVEPGIGRTRSYRSSQLVAVLEALERYGGVGPGGKRTVVRGSFAEFSGRALDPRTLGVHPPESYRDPDFYYRPFDVDQQCRWVWGYSFARREPILVPETVAYYHVHTREGEGRPFLFEISNGCALGSCLEEAILYGILETAERDAFLMTWYTRTAAPRVDLDTALDREIPLLAAMIAAETGYEAQIYDTTGEHGIPSVWAMAVGPDDLAAGRPKLVCAAGSNLVPERAVLNALSELGPILVDFIRRYPNEVERSQRLVDDPLAVTTMQDHSTLYGAPAAFDRLDFLTSGPERTSLEVLRASVAGAFSSHDLSADLRVVIDRYLNAGQDVIVVDQTTAEHRTAGLACVKVLIPGTLPMTFGHRNRRTLGLPRLDRAPLPFGELNPDPHPFP